MELSTLFIAVVFVIPFALGLILLCGAVVDTLAVATAGNQKATKTPATKDCRTGNVGPYLPA